MTPLHIRSIRYWFAAAALGLAALLLLGRLAGPEPPEQTPHRDAAAAPLKPISLTDDNLPDAVASLRLQLRAIRVGWDHHLLTIDLLMPDGERRTEAAWRDLASIVRFSFGETANVRQTLVRIYREADHGRRVLLFYGDPSRADWPPERVAALKAPDQGSADEFRRLIGLSATPAGDRWLSNM